MDIQTLKELFLTRQSCRSFSSRPVSKEQIEEICSLAALAPSACDLQPWKVYAVTGEKRKPLADFLIGSGKAPFVGDAPAFLIIAENPAASRERPTLSYYAPSDTGEFTAHLILAAKAAGLDTCILGWQNRPGLKELAGITDAVNIPYVVALGYASEGYETRSKDRRPFSETLTFIG